MALDDEALAVIEEWIDSGTDDVVCWHPQSVSPFDAGRLIDQLEAAGFAIARIQHDDEVDAADSLFEQVEVLTAPAPPPPEMDPRF